VYALGKLYFFFGLQQFDLPDLLKVQLDCVFLWVQKGLVISK